MQCGCGTARHPLVSARISALIHAMAGPQRNKLREANDEGRTAGISGCRDGTASERHFSRQARERARNHRPHGRPHAQEPDPRACRRQGARGNDALRSYQGPDYLPVQMIGRAKLVLASGSPRRLSLVNQAGIEPDALRPADIDETPKRGELPRACATRLARLKAEAALAMVRIDDELKGSYVLAADTVVAVGRRILPKAELLDEAAQCLRLLSGRNHRVHTAVCLVTPNEKFRQRHVETRVRFKRLSEEDIEAYLASGEWRGKAGGYAAQGIAGTFIVKIVGSYSNIVGLPLYETTALLWGEGYPIHFGWLNTL